MKTLRLIGFLLFAVLLSITTVLAKTKNSKWCVAYFEASDGWEFVDENIAISYSFINYDMSYILESGGETYFDQISPHVSIIVENKTGDFVYLDLGKSFIIRNGNAEAFWNDTKVYKTEGKNSNTGVNVGAIANVLGVGGVVGDLANGVTVGTGKTGSNTTVTTLPRVEILPPFSKKEIKTPICKGDCYSNRIEQDEYALCYNNYLLPQGETVEFSKDNSPISFSGIINYSLSETCETSKNVVNHFYLNKMIGMRVMFGFNKKYLKELRSLGIERAEHMKQTFLRFRKL